MNKEYYAGHDFSWIKQFLMSIPKQYRKDIALGIAEAIHHQFRYKKSEIFNLTHATLDKFGVCRKRLPTYLHFFQGKGLISYEIKKGSAPRIQLLFLPQTNYRNNSSMETSKDTIKKLIYTEQVPQIGQVHVSNKTGDLSQIGQVNLPQIEQVFKRVKRKGRQTGRLISKASKTGRQERGKNNDS